MIFRYVYQAIDMNAFKVIAMPSDSLIHLDALNTFYCKKNQVRIT